MCGVAGWLDARSSIHRAQDSAALLDRMRDSLIHRGPDDFGSWLSESGQIAVANRRLSIVDLSERARQPMISKSADIVLSYNGEIYNHLELRGKLEHLGYRFQSSCDTETVLYAFQEWGIDCLHRFKGQFAFAVWDGRSQTLYLARDRVGLQPMYFYSLDGLLVFGSEMRAILSHPEVRAGINFGAMYQYFVMHAPAPPFTILENVYAVPAGAYVRCKMGETPRLERYWSLLDEIGCHDLSGSSESEIAERVRETLMQAVGRRLMSDRPVGLFLSGGLDSTAVLGCLSALGQRDVRSFSIGYEDTQTQQTSDEFEFAREAAKEFGSTHTMLRSQPGRLQEFAGTCDQPPENLVEFWLWEMAETASAAGIPVILHGEGSDELMFGYDFHWQVLSEWQQVQTDPTRALNPPFDSGIPVGLRRLRAEDTGHDPTADLMFWGGGVHPRFEFERQEYFSPDRIPAELQTGPGLDMSHYRPSGDSADVLSFVQDCYSLARSTRKRTDYRQRMQFLEFVHKLPEVLLRRGERSCMKHSVEMRLPFLDEDVVSLAVNLPLASLRRGQTVKYPLRQAMQGVVPERIRNRPKEFFGRSFLDASQKWPRDSEWFRHYLLESEFTSLGLVSKKYLQSKYDRVIQDNIGFETFLWKQVFAAVWFDNVLAMQTP